MRCFKNEVVVGFWEHVRARVLVVPRDATLSLFFCSTSAKLAHDYFPLTSPKRLVDLNIFEVFPFSLTLSLACVRDDPH